MDVMDRNCYSKIVFRAVPERTVVGLRTLRRIQSVDRVGGATVTVTAAVAATLMSWFQSLRDDFTLRPFEIQHSHSSSNSATMASESPDLMANQEPAEAQEECSGKKKSKFQTFKKLFARKKRKEAAGAEAGMKSSQSSDNVSKTSEENTLTRSEKETGSGSKISLGNKALSHDSIFVSDSSEANEALGASQDSIHGKVKSLQLQLKQAIRLGSPPSLMCVKKMEDAGTTSEDDGLPCSPPEYTTPQAAMKQTHSSSSVSLEAVGGDDGQLPCASSSRGVSPLVAPGDFSQPASPMACLDNSAAKHKLGLRHKACNRRKPARKLESRTEGQDMMDGTLDTSVSEPKEEPEQVVSLEELKSGFTREMEEENDKDEDDTEDEEEEEPSQHSRKSLLSYSEESVEEEDSQSEDEQDISHNLDTSCPPEEDTPDPLHLSSPSSGTSSLETPRASPEPPAGPREYLLDPLSTAYESVEDEVESRLLQKEEEEEEETSEKEEEEEEEEEEESLLQEVLSSLKTPLVSCPISVKTEEVFLELETRKEEEEEAVEVKDQEEEEKKEERSEVEELFSYQCHNAFTKEEEEEEEKEEEEDGGRFTPSCQEELVSTEQERKSDNEEPEEEEEEEDGQLVNDQEEDEAAEDDETEEHKPEEKSFTDTGESEIQAQDVRDDKESEMEQEEEEEEEEEEEGLTLELQKEQEFDEEQWESRETHDEEGEEEEVDVQQVSLRVEMEEELEAEEEGDEEEGEEESVCDGAEEETGVLVSLGGAERGEGDNSASETKQGDDDEEEEDEILSKPSDESRDEVMKDTEVSEVAEENVEVTAEQEWEQETQEVDEDESEEEEEEVTKDSDRELKQEEEEKTEVLEEVVSPARLPSLTLADSPCRPSSPEVGAVSPPLSPTKSGTTTVHINLVSPSAEKPPPVFRQVAETVDAAEKQEMVATDEDQPVASVVERGPASADDTVQQTPSRSEQSKARFTIAPAWQRSHSLTPPSSPPPCLTPVSPTLAEYKGEELETTTTAAAEKESVVKAEPVSSPEVDVVWSPGRARNSGNSAAPPSSSSSSKPQNSAADTEESCVRSEGNPDSPFGIRLRKTSASHLFSSEEENTEMTSPSDSPPQTTAPRVEPPPTVGVKPATNPSVSHRPVVPKKPEMHGDGGGKAKLFSDPAAARGGSVGSDSPSWISMAKQKQKIYQEKSLDMTVKKEEQEKKPSLPPQASRGQGSKTPESPGKVTLPAVKEAKRDLPPPTPVPAQPSKAHLLPCAVPPKPYVPPSTTKPVDQRSRPSPTPVPVPQKPNSCTSPSSPPKPVTTSPSKPLPPQSAAVTPAAFSLVTAPEKSGPRAAVSPQRGLTGPPLPQDEPPWMALAKKKAKAWSEMPQIVQ